MQLDNSGQHQLVQIYFPVFVCIGYVNVYAYALLKAQIPQEDSDCPILSLQLIPWQQGLLLNLDLHWQPACSTNLLASALHMSIHVDSSHGCLGF